MSDTFLMLWRPEGGPTVVLPFVDEGGEMSVPAREIADVFDERGMSPDAGFWRMVAGDRAEQIARLQLQMKEAAELAEAYREMFQQKAEAK